MPHLLQDHVGTPWSYVSTACLTHAPCQALARKPRACQPPRPPAGSLHRSWPSWAGRLSFSRLRGHRCLLSVLASHSLTQCLAQSGPGELRHRNPQHLRPEGVNIYGGVMGGPQALLPPTSRHRQPARWRNSTDPLDTPSSFESPSLLSRNQAFLTLTLGLCSVLPRPSGDEDVLIRLMKTCHTPERPIGKLDLVYPRHSGKCWSR